MSPRFWILAALLGFAVVAGACAPAAAQTAGKCSQDMTVDNNWWDAVTDCTQAIAQNSSDDNAYVNRCDAYINLGNYTSALADCSRAISLNSKNEAAYVGRCYIYSHLGQIAW